MTPVEDTPLDEDGQSADAIDVEDGVVQILVAEARQIADPIVDDVDAAAAIVAVVVAAAVDEENDLVEDHYDLDSNAEEVEDASWDFVQLPWQFVLHAKSGQSHCLKYHCN